jgi:xanthine dehydrogenase accessory factor
MTHDWPDDALAAFAPDRRSAIVTLTHDPKLDDPALEGALRSPAFYIGALGSRKTHGLRLERLRQAGFSEDALGRINGPIGLAIGAKSPAEIALAIMAQVTAALRLGPDAAPSPAPKPAS